MNRILITGGAGFIGSNVIDFVLKIFPRFKLVRSGLDHLLHQPIDEVYLLGPGEHMCQK